MPIATLSIIELPPSDPVKMEDRKRPASGNADDLAPPSKRQAVNGGGSKAKDDAGDAKEETWIEVSVTRHCPFYRLADTASSHVIKAEMQKRTPSLASAVPAVNTTRWLLQSALFVHC